MKREDSLLIRDRETLEVAPLHCLALTEVERLSEAFADHIRVGSPYVAYHHAVPDPAAYGGMLALCKGVDDGGLCWNPITRRVALPLPEGWETRRDDIAHLAGLLLQTASGEGEDELRNY